MTLRSASLSCAACALLPIALAAAQLPGPVPREKEPPSQTTRMHDDELTGVAIVPASPDGSTTTDVQTKSLGKKGRLTMGVRESGGPQGEVKQAVRFKVTSVQHMHDGCSQY